MTMLDDDLGGVWTLDPDRTAIGFTARQTSGSMVRCLFADTEGTISICSERASRSRVAIRIGAASLATGDDAIDAELRSADFLDTEQHPEVVFRSTVIDHVADARWLVVGDLTIRGITRQLSLDAEFTGPVRDPDGAVRAGLVASGRIDRRDWGLHWEDPLTSGGAFVMEKTLVEIDASVVKTASVEEMAPMPARVTGPAGPLVDTVEDGQGAARFAGMLRFLRRRFADQPTRHP